MSPLEFTFALVLSAIFNKYEFLIESRLILSKGPVVDSIGTAFANLGAMHRDEFGSSQFSTISPPSASKHFPLASVN